MVKFVNQKSARSASADTIELSERQVSVRASTADDTAMTIDAVLSTEDPVGMFDYEDYCMMDEVLLASGRQKTDWLPMLDSHNRWSVEEVLGHMSNIRTENGQTIVTCNFDKNDEESVKIFKKYRDGHARGLSVGYTVRKYIDISPGQSTTIAGRNFKASPTRKLRVATDWVAKEGSCVAIGADAKALTRSAAIGVRGLSVEMTEEQAEQARAIHERRKQNRKRKQGSGQRSIDSNVPDVEAQVEDSAEPEVRLLAEGTATLQSITPAPSVVININSDGNVRTENITPAVPETVVAASEAEESRTAPSATTEESTLDSVTQSVPAVVGGNTERNATMSGENTAEQTAAEVEKARVEARKEGIRAEKARQDSIRELAGDDVTEETLTRCLQDIDMTPEQAQKLFLDDIRAQRKAASPPVGSDSPKPLELSGNKRTAPSIDVLTAAVALRYGGEAAVRKLQFLDYSPGTNKLRMKRASVQVDEQARKEHERIVNEAYAHEGRSSVDICEMMLRASKIEVPMERMDIVERSFSTPAISTVYTQTMGAILLANIAETADSTMGWCKEQDVKNFKTNELHRFEGGVLTRRNRGEVARPASFADTMEQYSIKEYASVMNIDRQDLIDDDLNAWLTALDEYARGVQDLRPSLVYGFIAANAALATDSVTLFHADHNNLITSSALAAATLQTAVTKLASQRGPGGLNLNLRNCVLITSETLSFTADQLTTSAEIREAAAANGTNNPLRLRSIATRSDSRLNNGFTYPLTGEAVAGAGTTWYLAAAGGAYGIHVGYLQGTNRMPTMSTTVHNGGGKYGMSMDVNFDIGVGVQSYQGLVKATA